MKSLPAVSIPDALIFSWESQAEQYPVKGLFGIRYFKGETGADCDCNDDNCFVDCLLYRDERGNLLGILNHYNHENFWEQPGNANLWVHPDHRRKGIGTALVKAAMQRWQDIDLMKQQFTAAGRALALSIIKETERRSG